MNMRRDAGIGMLDVAVVIALVSSLCVVGLPIITDKIRLQSCRAATAIMEPDEYVPNGFDGTPTTQEPFYFVTLELARSIGDESQRGCFRGYGSNSGQPGRLF